MASLQLGMSPPASAATLPSGFSEQLVATGLADPTAMAFAPDGRLFVTEQSGRLRVVKNGALLASPFLTVLVDSSGERGLLGVTFDPNFATNNFVYVYYTATLPAVHNRISRFTAAGDVAAAGSETIILELNNLSAATNHNGGAIHFGPDGKLYAAVGENANGANAQNMSNLLGKMLRLNPDGSIPTDNPFFSTASGRNRAIWALGVRNPFTFSFQPGTGRMFINDVGQATWEEVNDGAAGANYGWPATEGPTTDPRFVSPIFAYGHGTGATTGCAITGGAFYNPSTAMFPTDHVGQYFFADFCSGWIRRLDPATRTAVGFASGVSSPVDLKVAADGALYSLARGGGSTTGQVVRISYDRLDGVAYPASTTIETGTLGTGDASRLAADDDSFFKVRSSTAGRTSWFAGIPAVPNDLASLRVTYSGRNSVDCSQTVSMYRWTTAAWEILDSRTVGPGEVRIADLAPAGPPAEYVSGSTGDGKVRVRVKCRGASGFVASADLMEAAFTR